MVSSSFFRHEIFSAYCPHTWSLKSMQEIVAPFLLGNQPNPEIIYSTSRCAPAAPRSSSLIEALHCCTFDALMCNENLRAMIIRSDQAVVFLAVEPLHGSLW